MEKKIYNSPLTEVKKFNMGGALLSSPVVPPEDSLPPFPHPGGNAPKHLTPVF